MALEERITGPDGCPRCGRRCPKEERVNGVCPKCKKILKSTVKLANEAEAEPAKESDGHVQPLDGVHFDEASKRVSTTDDMGGAWFTGLCNRHGFSEDSAAEFIQEYEVRSTRREAPQTDVGAVRDEISELRSMIERGFIQVQEYEKNHGDRVLAERCMWLLLGFWTLAGADSQAGLVTLMGKHCTRKSHWTALKARVNKCLQFFQSQVPELPPLPGQRSEEASEAMAKAQQENWKQGVVNH